MIVLHIKLLAVKLEVPSEENRNCRMLSIPSLEYDGQQYRISLLPVSKRQQK